MGNPPKHCHCFFSLARSRIFALEDVFFGLGRRRQQLLFMAWVVASSPNSTLITVNAEAETAEILAGPGTKKPRPGAENF